MFFASFEISKLSASWILKLTKKRIHIFLLFLKNNLYFFSGSSAVNCVFFQQAFKKIYLNSNCDMFKKPTRMAFYLISKFQNIIVKIDSETDG